MTVRLFNDQVNGNGKAMGKWWLDISAGSAFVLENGNMVTGGSTGKTPMVIYAVQDYVAAVYSDDPSVETRTHVRVETILVDPKSSLEISVSAQGGQAT